MKSEIRESQAAATLRELFTELATGFTKHPEEMRVEINQAANFVTLTPMAHAEDSAKLVGRAGHNFNAMRTLLQFAADKLNVRLHLSRVRDLPGTKLPDYQASYADDPNWPKDEIQKLLASVCGKLFTMFIVSYEHQPKKSCLIITLPEDEKFVIPQIQVEECLGIIVAAIGRNHGRVLGVRLASNLNLNQTKSDGNNSRCQAASR